MQGDNRGKAWPRHGHILVGAHGVEGPGEEANERWTLQRSSGMTVPRYVCTADTEPPPGNVIRCDSTNILIRSLLLNKAKQAERDAASTGKRPAEHTNLAQENASASKRLYVGDTPSSSSATTSASSSHKPPPMSLTCMLAEGHLTELVLNERWVKVEHLKALLRSKKLPCSGHKKALIKSLLQYQRRVALASRPTSTATSTSVVAEGPATSD